MYEMNNDFFDYFTVLFDRRESIIGGHWNPLGAYAAEALNVIETKAYYQINPAVREFKEELQIFLSSRSPSSAALAQQKLDRLWALLGRLPVYNRLFPQDRGARYLFAHMREHPEKVDTMLTPGSGLNQTMNRWLQKMDNLTRSLRQFWRNTHWMLDDYFEDLPSRKPESYARAYSTFRRDAWGDIEMMAEEGQRSDAEDLVFDFPVRLSFEAAFVPGSDKVILAEKMVFDELANFLYVDLCKGMAAGNIPRRCRNCQKYFLTIGGYDTIYCSNRAPGEKKKTCRQVGAHRTEKIKNDQSPIQKEYTRAYNRLKARKQRGSISIDEWNRQVAAAQELRDQMLEGRMELATYRLKLQEL